MTDNCGPTKCNIDIQYDKKVSIIRFWTCYGKELKQREFKHPTTNNVIEIIDESITFAVRSFMRRIDSDYRSQEPLVIFPCCKLNKVRHNFVITINSKLSATELSKHANVIAAKQSLLSMYNISLGIISH